MATLQYIGARYVPKFYEGSNGSEWDSGVAYEPLTIVTYLGSSWTSKKPVPSNIGAPNLNSQYWVNTGNFNAEAAQIIQLISELQEDLDLVEDTQLLYLTPEMFGAVGDGVTDDRYAIQTCLEAAEQAGKSVIFAERTYAIEGQISLVRSALADGWYFSIFMKNGTTIKYTGSTTTDSVLYFKNFGDKLRVTGGTIDCNQIAKNGLVFDTCNGVYVSSMNILNAGASGLNYGDIVLKDCKHCWIEGCKLVNRETCSYGIISLNSPDTRIYNCEISYVDVGIYSNYGILLLTNNHIWAGGSYNQHTDTIGILLTDNSPRLFMDECYIDAFITAIDCGERACRIFGAGNLFYWPDTTVHNPGQHVKGIKCVIGSGIYLKGTYFQSVPSITVDEIDYSEQIAYYSGNIRDLPNLFNASSNVSTVARLTCREYDHTLNVEFQVKLSGVTTDQYGVIPLLATGEKPAVIGALQRVDFIAWNATQHLPVPCRCGLYTTDNILIVHCSENVNVDDIIYGSFMIKLR